MSEATTFSGVTGGTYTIATWEPGMPNARSAIRCEVNAKGELELYPNDALGAYFLRQFGHGTVRVAWSYVAHGPENGLFQDFSRLTIGCESHALLSRGGDPFYTGMPLSADEQKACRELVDQMRGQKAKQVSRKRKNVPPKEAP